MTTVRAVLKEEDDLASALSAYSVMAAAGNPGAALNAAFLLKQFGSSTKKSTAQSPHVGHPAIVHEEDDDDALEGGGESGSMPMSSSRQFDSALVNKAEALTRRLLDSAAAALRDHMGTTRDLFRESGTTAVAAAGSGSDSGAESVTSKSSIMWNTTMMTR